MPVKLYRIAHWCWRHGIPVIPQLIKAFNRIVFAVVLPPSALLGKSVLLSYHGLGTIIHRRAVIGDRVTVGAGVTIGGRSGSIGVPVIGEGAFIGGGAKVIGDIKIGAYASIGANAVVLNDVPEYGVAVGIPARIVRINKPEDLPNYRSFQEGA